MRRLAALALGLLLVSCGQGHQIGASTSVPTSAVPASSVPATTALAPTTTAINVVDEPTSAVYLVMNGALHTVGRALGATDRRILIRHLVPNALAPVIAHSWSLATALSLLAWFVFAPQCISTLATVRRETNSWRYPAAMAIYLFALAYGAAFVTYHVTLALTA